MVSAYRGPLRLSFVVLRGFSTPAGLFGFTEVYDLLDLFYGGGTIARAER